MNRAADRGRSGHRHHDQHQSTRRATMQNPPSEAGVMARLPAPGGNSTPATACPPAAIGPPPCRAPGSSAGIAGSRSPGGPSGSFGASGRAATIGSDAPDLGAIDARRRQVGCHHRTSTGSLPRCWLYEPPGALRASARRSPPGLEVENWRTLPEPGSRSRLLGVAGRHRSEARSGREGACGERDLDRHWSLPRRRVFSASWRARRRPQERVSIKRISIALPSMLRG
jgi:hypothetical protein